MRDIKDHGNKTPAIFAIIDPCSRRDVFDTNLGDWSEPFSNISVIVLAWSVNNDCIGRLRQWFCCSAAVLAESDSFLEPELPAHLSYNVQYN